jgi:hypothetical protein
MGSGISPPKQERFRPSRHDNSKHAQEERERAKAAHIIKTFDFNKLFYPNSTTAQPRISQSEVRPKTAAEANRKNKVISPNLCDKCGSPTNAKEKFDRLQSAPAHRLPEQSTHST